MKRVISANTIQKWWRKVTTVRKCERNIIHEIRVKRAQILIGRWLRDLTFRHRGQLSKLHSFKKYAFKEMELFMQLDIYMKMPLPSDLLRFKDSSLRQDSQYLYEILHKNTEV